MNFDDIKSMWNDDKGEGTVPDSVTQLKTLALPIEKIRRRMQLELYIQLISLVMIGVAPKFGYVGPIAAMPFYVIYFVAVTISIYYFSKFHVFYKHLNTSTLRSKDHLYELYYEGKLNIEMYKSFAYTLIPLTLIGVGLRMTSTSNEKMKLLFQAAQTNQGMAVALVIPVLVAVLVMMLSVNLWVKFYYGRYLNQIKVVLDEFKEA